MLSPYRVLDLTDESGLLCGQILSDLGADVIQIEPPGGSPARRVPPFAEPGGDSLFFWAYARGKRSLALDLESEAGRDELRDLVRGADFLIESASPGRMADLGLDYPNLARHNPALVYVSITPFGQLGPRAHWQATDLTIAAAGGAAYLNGEGPRPPVRTQVPQAHAHAGADAAVGALIAHFERQRSGRGQHVDISAQQSMTLATMFRVLDVPIEQVPARRISGSVQAGATELRTRFALRDGWVVVGPHFLPSTGHFMIRLLEWARDEGFDTGALLEEDWASFALRLVAGKLPADAYEPAEALLSELFASKTREQLMQAAVERKLLAAPVLGLDQIIESDQLRERGFAITLGQGSKSVRFPGPFTKFGARPIRQGRPAPLLDEHVQEIRGEAREPRTLPLRAERIAPLAGVKVLDLFWVLAGPGATRMLADYGASVVRVESTKHLDTLRAIPPYQFSAPHPEGAGAFQCANANKLGITLDLGSAEGRAVVLDLVRWADVVTESFSPGVIDQYGLGYDTLRELKPDIIMISSCLSGQTGPWRDFTGFGNLAASVTGFQTLASWPERPPSGPYGAYTDFIAVRYNAISILAALEHRARTGEGQYIDQAQAESALQFVAPAFLDYTVNGRVPEPVGNHDPRYFPHDVFPTVGEDQWVAISARDERDWSALCEAMGQPALVGFRDDRQRVLRAVSAWTSEQVAEDVATRLQARGVPAHAVLDMPGAFACPQLQSREHFIEIAHDIYPTTWIESGRLRLSESPARKPERALSAGRDTEQVLTEILGYPIERVKALAKSGALC